MDLILKKNLSKGKNLKNKRYRCNKYSYRNKILRYFKSPKMKKMKSLMSFFLLLSCLFIFSNCKKDIPNLPIPPEPLFRVTGYCGMHKVTVNATACTLRGLFCENRYGPIDHSDAYDLLELGEISGTGNLSSTDSGDVLDFNFSKVNLSQEAVEGLIMERTIELDALEFSPNMVKEMYELANMEYIPYKIEEGLYDIEVKGANDIIPAPDDVNIEMKLTNTNGIVDVKTILSY